MEKVKVYIKINLQMVVILAFFKQFSFICSSFNPWNYLNKYLGAVNKLVRLFHLLNTNDLKIYIKTSLLKLSSI